MIAPRAGVIMEVGNEAEFRTAMNNVGIDEIHFTADIRMTSGVTNSSKNLVIEGNNFQFIEENTGSNITITGGSNLEVRNLTIYGRQFYSTFYSGGNSNLTYNNVTYYGPQMVYNPGGGVTTFKGNNKAVIRSQATGSTNALQEFGEVSKLVFAEDSVFEGNIEGTNTYSAFAFANAPAITIGVNAKINLDRGVSNYYGIFYGISGHSIDIQEGASFVAKGKNLLMTGNNLGGLRLGRNAHFEFTQSLPETSGIPAINLVGNVTIGEGSTLRILGSRGNAPLHIANASTPTITIGENATFDLEKTDNTANLISGQAVNISMPNLGMIKQWDSDGIMPSFQSHPTTVTIKRASNGQLTVTAEDASIPGQLSFSYKRRVLFTAPDRPLITADTTVTYEHGGNKTAEEFLADIHAEVTGSGTLSTDFTEVVDFTTPGTYAVMLHAVDAYGVTAIPVEVTVIVLEKAGPTLTVEEGVLQNGISYTRPVLKTEEQFLIDIGAVTEEGNTIHSNFSTVLQNTMGTYLVTLYAEDTDGKTSEEIQVSVHIIGNTAPVIAVNPAVVHVQQNAAVNILFGVTATDLEDGAISVTHSVLDTSIIGLQKVTYTAEDSDGNKATDVRTYVVGNAIISPDNKYAIIANDFDLRVSQVDASTGGMIASAGAKAYDIGTTAPIAIGIVETNGYAPIHGSYNITFNISASPTTEITIIGRVSAGSPPLVVATPELVQVPVGAVINELDGVVVIDPEDGNDLEITFEPLMTSTVGIFFVEYTVVDSDGNIGNARRTYIIGNATVGTDYVIFAEDFTIRKTLANINNLIRDASARAYRLSDGSQVTVRINDSDGYKKVIGTYNPVFSINEESGTTITITATVDSGSLPILSIDPLVLIVDQGASVRTLDGVTVEDFEDGDDLYIDVSILNTANTGLQIVTYSVTDSDDNEVTATRTYVVGNAVMNDEYAIMADDFSLRVSEVDVANVITDAKVKAYNLTTGDLVDVELKELGGYTAAEGTYEITFNVVGDTTLDQTITASVLMGQRPIMDIDPLVVVVAQGAYVDELVGITVTDFEDGTIIPTHNEVDTTIDGIQKVMYSATDADGNIITGVRTYVIGNAVVNATHAIIANNFNLLVSQVDTANVISDAGAKAYRLDTGDEVAVEVQSLGGYTNVAAVYNVIFNLVGDNTFTKTIVATVETGNLPVLTIIPKVVLVAQHADIEESDGVTAEDIEDETLIITHTLLDTSLIGVQKVTYETIDSDNNVVTGERMYVIGDAVVENGYAIFANDFERRIGQVQEQLVIVDADAKAYELAHGEEVAVEVFALGGYMAAVGTYQITFAVEEEKSTTKTITATVISGNYPSLLIEPALLQVEINSNPNLMDGVSVTDVEDAIVPITHQNLETSQPGVFFIEYTAIDSDGNTVTGRRTYVVGNAVIGTEYVIFAKDFDRMVSEVDPSMVVSDANAVAYKLSDGSVGTVRVSDLDGYTNSAGTYNPVFYVEEEKTTEISIRVRVSPGTAPVLVVNPKYMVVPQNSVNDVMYGIYAYDAEQGFLPVTATALDTSEIGMQFVTYTVIDEDMNEVTKTRGYVVGNGVIGTDYAIIANDFEKRVGQVNTSTVIADASAKAYRLNNGSTRGVRVTELGGYTYSEGEYNITFAVLSELDTNITIKATVIAGEQPTLTIAPEVRQVARFSEVNVMDGVSASDPEDGEVHVSATNLSTMNVGVKYVTYTAMDSDDNIVTGVRTYVIGNSVIGDGYAIIANDFSRRVSLVNIDNVITDASATAYKLSDGTEVEVGVESLGGYQAVADLYDVTFKVVEEVGVQITIVATVLTGNAPVLTVEPERVLVAQNTTVELLDGVSATDIEDGSITPTHTSLDTSEVGVYFVEYSVTDVDNNTVKKTRTYVVGDGIIGTNYAIIANDFELRVGQVDIQNIIADASATAYDLSDGSLAVVEVQSLGGYSAVVGEYEVIFNVVDEIFTTKKITATVVSGDVPVLTINPERVLVAQGSEVVELDGVTATDTEDGNVLEITHTIVDTAVIGVQFVEYSVVDLDGNEDTGIRTYVIGNGVIGTDYAIIANDFTWRVSQVDVDNVITDAGATAFSLLDGSRAEVEVHTLGGYDAAVGVYNVIFKVAEEKATRKAIAATVREGDHPILAIDPKVVNVAQNAQVTTLTGVLATDTEDGVIIPSATPLDTSETGVFFVTYTATDTDENIATGVRTYIVGEGAYGADYAIIANDFTKRISQVDVDNVVTDATAKAYSLLDGSITNVEIQTLGGYDAATGTYTIVFKVANEPTTTRTITATVVSGDAPVLTINPERVLVAQGSDVVELDGVSATDTEDGNGLEITHTTVDTTAVGVQFVEYSVIDADGNEDTGIRTYVIGNGVIGTDYAIIANDFAWRVSQVNVDNVILDATATAYSLIDGSAANLAVESLGGYAAAVGSYNVKFHVVSEPETAKVIVATVATGDLPIMTITPEIMIVPQNSSVQVLTGVTVTDTEDDVIIPTATMLDTSTLGVQFITYTAVDTDGNEVIGRRTYVVGAGVIGQDYAIIANSFSLRVGQVSVDNAVNDAQTKAYKLSDGTEVDVKVHDFGGYEAQSGIYDITFAVVDEPETQRTITATIHAGASPILIIDPERMVVDKHAVVNVLEGVSASDTEDGPDLTVIPSGLDTAIVGVRFVTYEVEDSDNNYVSGIRRYVVGNGVIGTDYAIIADDFSRRVSEVDIDEVITDAATKAYRLSDGVEVAVEVLSLGGYNAAVGNYDITFNIIDEVTTTQTITATVTAGSAPELTIDPEQMIVPLGADVELLDGVSATDIEDGDDLVIFATDLDTSVIGVTRVTYTVTDADGNMDTGERVYVVGNAAIGTDYVIIANDFTLQVSQVDIANVMNDAGAKAFKLSDGSIVAVEVTALNGYDAIADTYAITFNVVDEKPTEKTIIATVLAGNPPVLTINPERMVVAENAVIDVMDGISATDIEDVTTTVTATELDTSIIGVQIVTYTVMDADKNIVTGIRTYVVGNAVIGTDYAIIANDFDLRVSQVDIGNVISDAAASAYKLSDGSIATVNITALNGYDAVAGTYNVTFHVAEENTTEKTIVATVLSGTAPVLTVDPDRVVVAQHASVDLLEGVSMTDVEDGNDLMITSTSLDTSSIGVQKVIYTVTDTDNNTVNETRTYVIGNAVIGINYAIIANDFELRVSQVDATNVISDAAASAYKLSDGSIATVNVTTLGGYDAVAGTYNVAFHVAEEITTEKTIVATVLSGAAPVLTVDPDRVVVAQHENVDLLDGVSVTDVEDGTDLIITPTSLNTSIVGVQFVTYTVTDSDANTITGIRTYIVGNAIIGTDYAIIANDFALQVSQVDSATIIANAQAKAFKLSDGSEVAAEVNSDGGYTAVAEIYNITFNVVDEVSTEITIVATVLAGDAPVLTIHPERVVVSQDATVDIMIGVSVTDTEDGDNLIVTATALDTTIIGVQIVTYTVTDTDNNMVTGTRTYIVGNGIIGTDYAIIANDFDLRVSQVNVNNVIADANATAYKLSDGSAVHVAVQSLGGYDAIAGTYEITFMVVDEQTTEITIVATVITGNNPVLTITPEQMVVAQDAIVDVMDGIYATDIEDGDLFATATLLDTAVVGMQIVTYTVIDADSNIVTGTRTYIIGNGIIGTDYAIIANDFELLVSEVDVNNVIVDASVIAYKLSDGSITPVEITTLGGYDAVAGIYEVTFNVKAETTTEITINATVLTGNIPILTINPKRMVVPQGATVEVLAGVIATDVEDGNLEVTASNLDTRNVGVQTVTYTVTDTDNNTVIGTRTYVIGNAVIGSGYAIIANDFTNKISQVNIANVMLDAKATAYNLSDGSVAQVEVKSLGGYAAIVGTYPVTFNVLAEMATEITIIATVHAGNAPKLMINPDRMVIAQDANVDVLDGVSAIDVEDGAINVSASALDTSIVGVQHVTYTATDRDNNTVTGTRTYIIGNGVIGDRYAIIANDFELLVSKVDVHNVIAEAQATAYNLSNGSATNVVVKSLGGYNATAGMYNITFGVEDELKTTITIVATVLTGNAPTLTVTPKVINVELGAAVDVLDGVIATDVEDGTLQVSATPLDTTVVGVQYVIYTATDTDGNIVTAKRLYIIGNAFIGDTYAIVASDFEQYVHQVVVGNVIKDAQAKAYRLSDGKEVKVDVFDLGGHSAVTGNYRVTFNVRDEKTTRITVNSSVLGGNIPILEINPTLIKVAIGAKVEVLDGVTAIDSEDGNLIVTSTKLTTDTAGVQIVTYTATDVDNNQVTGRRTYVIGNAIIGDAYAIIADDFTVHIDAVDVTGVITAAYAKAYNIFTGEEAMVVVQDLGGYTAIAGKYAITFAVAEEETTQITIVGAVVEDSKEVEETEDKPMLPITGERILEKAFLGITSLFIGFWILIKTIRRRKSEQK